MSSLSIWKKRDLLSSRRWSMRRLQVHFSLCFILLPEFHLVFLLLTYFFLVFLFISHPVVIFRLLQGAEALDHAVSCEPGLRVVIPALSDGGTEDVHPLKKIRVRSKGFIWRQWWLQACNKQLLQSDLVTIRQILNIFVIDLWVFTPWNKPRKNWIAWYMIGWIVSGQLTVAISLNFEFVCVSTWFLLHFYFFTDLVLRPC